MEVTKDVYTLNSEIASLQDHFQIFKEFDFSTAGGVVKTKEICSSLQGFIFNS